VPFIGQPPYGGQVSIYRESGTVYVYYRDSASGNLACQFGPSLLQLGAQVTATAKSTFNSRVVKGPGGVYYQFGDNATFNTYVATGLAPQGPFTVLSDPVVITPTVTQIIWLGSAWVEWTGGYFRMYAHGGIGANTPTWFFVLTSKDGITWRYANIGLDGTPTPIAKHNSEWTWNQVADARLRRVNGQLTLIYDINQGVNPNPSFLAVNNPAQFPIPQP
jgi:hypothetical protein